MELINYFAYGSNMLKERLQKHAPSCRVLGVARLSERRLCFRKRSVDNSGKCDIAQGDTTDSVLGIVYTLDITELDELDKAEGVGNGYKRIEIEVQMHLTGEPLLCQTYEATCTDETLQPYDWYKKLVLAGARQHKLPVQYIKMIEAVTSMIDPDSGRKAHKEALKLLEKIYLTGDNLEGDTTC